MTISIKEKKFRTGRTSMRVTIRQDNFHAQGSADNLPLAMKKAFKSWLNRYGRERKLLIIYKPSN